MVFDGTELILRVRDRAELSANNTLMTNTVLLRFINQALAAVSLEADWPWLRASATVNTVAGTATITTPTGWLRTQLLTHNDTSEPLERVRLAAVRRWNVTATGRPSVYAATGSVITLRSVPDQVYALTHDYVRSEPVLATVADIPLIPEVYGQGVIEYAAIKVFQRERQAEKAGTAAADYLAWKVRVMDNINQGRELLSITPRPGAWL